VRSEIRSTPSVATRWMLDILAHKSSMGSSNFHGSERAARLHSYTSGIIVPYSSRRCSNMANGVTLPKTKSGSSSALRNKGLMTVKVWAVSAAHRLLYNATSVRASV
jgi:hypothetical protein